MHSLDSPCFKGGEVNFGTSPGGGIMKDQKRGWKYGAGVGLKKGAGTFLI